MHRGLVRVEGVSKKFCRDLKRSLWYGLKDTAADLLGRTQLRRACVRTNSGPSTMSHSNSGAANASASSAVTAREKPRC